MSDFVCMIETFRPHAGLIKKVEACNLEQCFRERTMLRRKDSDNKDSMQPESQESR